MTVSCIPRDKAVFLLLSDEGPFTKYILCFLEAVTKEHATLAKELLTPLFHYVCPGNATFCSADVGVDMCIFLAYVLELPEGEHLINSVRVRYRRGHFCFVFLPCSIFFSISSRLDFSFYYIVILELCLCCPYHNNSGHKPGLMSVSIPSVPYERNARLLLYAASFSSN